MDKDEESSNYQAILSEIANKVIDGGCVNIALAGISPTKVE
jgi:hypothetical protein